jgi:tetratricopeptide (TPR) repeat protein
MAGYRSKQTRSIDSIADLFFSSIPPLLFPELLSIPMKANLFLTAIVFSTLPISIAQAARSPLADGLSWQYSLSHNDLHLDRNSEWVNGERLLSPTSGQLAIDSVSVVLAGRDITQMSDNSRSSSQLQGAKLDLQSAANYNDRGVAKFKVGNIKGAIQDYDRAISINPKYGESYVNRGIAKFKVGNIKGAIQDYDRAIAIDPKDGEAYYNRGIARFESGEERSAIQDFDRAIAIDPRDAEVYGNRGFAKSTLGDKKGAVADLTKAAKLFRQRGQAGDAEKMQVLVRQLTTN